MWVIPYQKNEIARHDQMSTASTSANLDVYGENDVVASYSGASDLQPGEAVILREFRDSLGSMRFLDMGVGGGRTTPHFAPRVKEYIGADYSQKMIRACEERYPDFRFAVCDARNMPEFPNASFEFVLFSYNGIDYVPHVDRLEILKEVRRVLKPDGWFFFSSHNLRFLPRLFRFPLFLSPSKMLRKLKKYKLLREHNPDFRSLVRLPYALLYDGLHEFRIKTYYVDPAEQTEQMRALGFRDIRILSEGGDEVRLSSSRLKKDTWCFYLCRR
jgi:ubiquinone/menaquinone biosynthesis C-methylase UbiE